MSEFFAMSGALQATMLTIGLAPSALLALLGFMFRERLKHALAKSLNAHTEEIKLQAQRDIEAYKVTLIASIERQKAQAELKKALAVKHATLEYEALAALHGAVGHATALLLARAGALNASAWTPAGRAAACAEIQPGHEGLTLALEKARIFLSDEIMSKGSQLSSTLSQLMVKLILQSDGPIESVLPYQPVMTTCTQIQKALKARVEVLTSIGAQIAEGGDAGRT